MPAAKGDRAVELRGFLRPAARRRAMAVLAAVSVLTTLGSVPSGSAEEIDERRERVEREIDRTKEHLDQSSAQLAASSQRLAEAVTALDGARATLARSRGEVAAAQTLDRQMQVELAEAVEDLSRARAALARGRVSVSDGEEALRAIAVHQYASGGPELMALSTVFTSQNPAQLTSELNSHRSVLDKEAATLARLEASQVMLAVQEKDYRNAEQEVASRRAAAAENLERKVQLDSQAEQAQVRIEDLVVVRSQARRAAVKAETADLRQLRQLEDERAQVSALLKRRAEEARRQAEAAARARAEAARARAEAAARSEATAKAAARSRAAARREGRSRTPKQADERHRAPNPAPSPVEAGLMSPVDGYLTSSYGMRFHPVYQRWSLHDGTDFGASCGTPIRAAASGTVIAMYYNSAYGNRIIMDHGLRRGVGLGTSYNHMSGFSSYVGQNVQRGDIIGYVGTTGASTGCHLHFMVFENGATVDPMTWL